MLHKKGTKKPNATIRFKIGHHLEEIMVQGTYLRDKGNMSASTFQRNNALCVIASFSQNSLFEYDGFVGFFLARSSAVVLLHQAHSVGWSVDGKLALGSTDGWVSLWDVDSHGVSRYVKSLGNCCVLHGPALMSHDDRPIQNVLVCLVWILQKYLEYTPTRVFVSEQNATSRRARRLRFGT